MLDFAAPLVYNIAMETQPGISTTGDIETTSLLRRNRDVAILSAIAGHLNRKIDVHEALHEVLMQVTRLLGLQTGWVWLLDEEKRARGRE